MPVHDGSGSNQDERFPPPSLLQYIYKKAQVAWAGLSMEQLREQLDQIAQFALLYPPQDEKAPNRVALVLSKETLAQQSLAKELGWTHCRRAEEGNTRATPSISFRSIIFRFVFEIPSNHR